MTLASLLAAAVILKRRSVSRFLLLQTDHSLASASCLQRMSGKSESSPAPLLKHKCPDCSYTTHRKKDLKVHLRVHSGERPFACPTCDSTFTLKANRDTHVRRVHLKSDQVACSWSQCDKTFSSVASLRLHVAAVHLKMRFSCPVAGCLFKSGRKGEIKRHVRGIHTKEKPFACSVAGCSYRSAYQSHLVRHRRSAHVGGHVACSHDGCLFRTLRLKYLKRHVESVHQKIVHYSCHVCSIGFYHRGSMQAHQQSHAAQGHPVSQCTSCQESLVKGFKRSSLVSQKEQPSASDDGVNDLLTTLHLDLKLLS